MRRSAHQNLQEIKRLKRETSSASEEAPSPEGKAGEKDMSDNRIYYSTQTKYFAKELRKNPTKEESKLWYEMLRTYKPQFRRQKQFGKYIVDFYCSSAKLVVELDGGHHFIDDEKEYDDKRTAYLESLGLTVLRFSNSDIDKSFEGVCFMIDKSVKDILEDNKTPSDTQSVPAPSEREP